MKVIKKYRVEKLHFPLDGVYNYDVQEWSSVDGGKTFWHCGFGKYCKTLAEANEYVKSMKGDSENE